MSKFLFMRSLAKTLGAGAIVLAFGALWNEAASLDTTPDFQGLQAAEQQAPAKKGEADRGKYFVEGPVKEVVAKGITPNGGVPVQGPGPNSPAIKDLRLDVGKGRIEIPLKKVVAGIPGDLAAAKNAPATDNPTVKAGNLRWHDTIEQAQAAAAKSNKPMLVFHMLGRLDKQFC